MAGLYWKRATTQGAMFAIVLGLASWIFMEVCIAKAIALPEWLSIWPPQLFGLIFSATGMLLGSLLPQLIVHIPTLHHT